MIRSISYSIDFRPLLDLQATVNSPQLGQVQELDGMFWRMLDYSGSHANITTQYMEEMKLACKAFPATKSTDEPHGRISSSKVRTYSTGSNHFTSYDLSPYLRHFVNDACRLLEPTTIAYTRKHTQLRYSNRKSLGAYIREVDKLGLDVPFNTQFIIELYEVWNDYKHRTTKGLHASSWSYENGKVIEATLLLPDVEGFTFVELPKYNIYDLVHMADKEILTYMRYTYSEYLSA